LTIKGDILHVQGDRQTGTVANLRAIRGRHPSVPLPCVTQAGLDVWPVFAERGFGASEREPDSGTFKRRER